MVVDTVPIHSIKKICSLMDLTSLNEADDSTTISVLCRKAVKSDTHVAAVCVYPAFVKQAANALRETSVKVATVVNFPYGNDPLDSVIQSIQSALNDGAEEIDMVFPYSRYLQGEESYVLNYLRTCKSICGDVILKVILETGALKEEKMIAKASELAIEAGADFLKTSTGKISVGATLEAAAVMLQRIKQSSHRSVGLKVSGGIRTIPDALEYIALAEKIMGIPWVNPLHFRIGASQLLDLCQSKLLG